MNDKQLIQLLRDLVTHAPRLLEILDPVKPARKVRCFRDGDYPGALIRVYVGGKSQGTTFFCDDTYFSPSDPVDQAERDSQEITLAEAIEHLDNHKRPRSSRKLRKMTK